MLIQFYKVDAAQRLVYGRIDETPDRAKEIFDYASSKANFQKWSDEMSKASDGKSLGNVRAMHKNVAAGKLVDIQFDDAAKAIDVCAHIVDNDEWEKIEQGVYTGFSPGGKYAKKWKDGDLTRYTALPNEISVVDRPCIPSATFTMIKTDGSEEQRPFSKGLDDVSSFADAFARLTSIARWVTFEAASEADGSQIPARLGAWLADGVSILTDMAQEEAQEASKTITDLVATLPPPPADMALAAQNEDMAKAGARHSKADKDRLQAIHDHSVGMGADCSGAAQKNDQAADLAKMEGLQADLTKLQGDLAKSSDDLKKVSDERDALSKRVAELEKLPTAGGPTLKSVTKADDVQTTQRSTQAAPTTKDEPKTYEEALKKAQELPPGPEKSQAIKAASKLLKN